MSRATVVEIVRCETWGGAQKIVGELCVQLTERSVTPALVVLSSSLENPLSSMALRHGLPHITVPYRGRRDIPSAAVTASRFCLRFKRPVLHSHLVDSDILAGLLASPGRSAWISTIHNVNRYYTRRRWSWVRRCFRPPDVAVYVSAAAHQLSLVRARESMVLYHFPKAGSPQIASVGPSLPVRAAVASRLVDGKGHRMLIDAIYQSRYELPVALDILGDGPLRPELEAYVADLGLGELVRFAGFVDAEACFAGYDLVIVPTEARLHEGLGLVAVEAIANGVPVLATRVGGLPEAVGLGGLVVSPTTVGLVDGLRRFATSAQLRHELRHNAQALAAARAAGPTFVDTYAKLIARFT